jgi:thiamine-phosphate pyrophosphorylase
MAVEFRLYLITDRTLVPDLPAAVARALAGIPPGAAAVQLREKDLTTRALFELALALRPICRSRHAPLLVNDRLDVALAAGLDGVHLGGGSVEVADARRLLGDRLVGVSSHSETQLSAWAGADFSTFGPAYFTPSKARYGAPVGLAALAAAARTGVPLFALGGVDAARAPEAIRAGARGVAAIRAWLAAPDPAEATAALYEAVAGA